MQIIILTDHLYKRKTIITDQVPDVRLLFYNGGLQLCAKLLHQRVAAGVTVVDREVDGARGVNPRIPDVLDNGVKKRCGN